MKKILSIVWIVSIIALISMSFLACPEPSIETTTPSKTGALSYVGRYANVNIDGAISITVSPDGNHVYVAANAADAVAWFTRD